MDKLGEDCLCREMPCSLISHLTGLVWVFVLTILFEGNVSDLGELGGGIGEKIPFGTSTEHLLYFCI